MLNSTPLANRSTYSIVQLCRECSTFDVEYRHDHGSDNHILCYSFQLSACFNLYHKFSSMHTVTGTTKTSLVHVSAWYTQISLEMNKDRHTMRGSKYSKTHGKSIWKTLRGLCMQKKMIIRDHDREYDHEVKFG